MHIGLNLLFLVPGETGGMEVATRALLPALVAAAPDVRFTAFINREAAQAGDGPWGEVLAAVMVQVRARNRMEWVRGEQQLLPVAVRRAGCDLVHSMGSTGPAWGSFRRVVTIHDVIYRRFPEAHAGLRSLGMRALVPLAARRSHRVIADSRSTRDDLVELLHLPAGKIDVVPLAAPPPQADPTPEPELRRRLALGERPLLLSTSAKRPHKNLLRLLEAHALLDARPLLVLPGYATDHEAELRAQTLQLGTAADVRFLGWVSEADLEGLYAAAAGFVFPSVYEGFGLPVLEAMTRGVPVACADAASLPEVVGDAALLFDPLCVNEIVGAIRRLLEDPSLAAGLRAAGREQAAHFTWERSAQGVLRSYERALR